MTCKEKLMKEHPDHINPKYVRGYAACPYIYGYTTVDNCRNDEGICCYTLCEDCWNQEVYIPISEPEQWAKDLRERYQNLRCEGFTSDDALTLLTAYLKGGNHNG